MSKRTNNPTRVFAMSFMLFVAVALVASEHIVSRAQDGQDGTNTNGSMQMNQTPNTNRGRGGRRATGRRNAPRRAANSNMNAGDDANMSGNMNSDMTGDAAGMQDANMNANASTEGMGTNNNMDPSMNTNNNMNPSMAAPTMDAPAMAPRAGMAAPTQSGDTSADTSGEQTDLSGTYTGTINFPDASLTGEATLTITGNTFSITTPTGTQSGRVTAVTTRGYTGVAMRFNDLTAPGGTPLTVSARARRTGDRLTLSKIPGGQDVSFTPAGGSTGGTRPRARRGTRRRG